MSVCGSICPAPEWGLPRQVHVAGGWLDIRSDYRDILTIFAALADPELSDQEKSWVVLHRFYCRPEEITDPEAALRAFARFADGGDGNSEGGHGPRLMDWEKDYPLIAPAVDRVLGRSSRQSEYLHWWEYLGAFREIGEGLFSQVVALRKKRSEGKRLSPQEREFLRHNQRLVELPARLGREEQDFLNHLLEDGEETLWQETSS